MRYLAQQPGGLTDVQFANDPTQSFRERNWFGVEWNLGALTLDYKPSSTLSFNTRTFLLKAGRDALGFLDELTRIDDGGPRDLLKDDYLNFGNETRMLFRGSLFDKPITLLAGVRAYRGNLERKQGDGTSGTDPSFSYVNPDRNVISDYVFPSQNFAVFAENILYLNENLTLTPGFRYEYIKTQAEGSYRHVSVNEITQEILEEKIIPESRKNSRHFPLFGLAVTYYHNDKWEAYANFSQNYRAINFNDIRVINPYFQVDSTLKDESGFNADIGWRGNAGGGLAYDLGIFYLSYQNRIGAVLREDTTLFRTYRYRTNISDSRHFGLESFAEWNILQTLNHPHPWSLSVLGNFSWTYARYTNSQEAAFEGNLVEQVPPILFKAGSTLGYKHFQSSLLFSYTDSHFTDATNAVNFPDAVHGIIPAYWVLDFSTKYRYRSLVLEGGINNLTNNIYFTRRADSYPGPGIIPANPRTFYLTMQWQWDPTFGNPGN